jgi:hypothetical protein
VRASMELTENDYILGVWFAEDFQGNNWIMTIKRPKDNMTHWFGEYRFRYKVDDKVFNSQDEKSFYSFEIKDQDEKEVLSQVNRIANVIKIKYGKSFSYTEVKGDIHKFQFRLAQEPFMNIQKLDKGEQ